MDWKKIDECWDNASQNLNGTLSKSNRSYFYGTVSTYRLEIETDEGKSIFEGKLTKKNSGLNQYHTKLIFESKHDQFQSQIIRKRKGFGRLFGKYSGAKLLGEDVMKDLEELCVETISINANQIVIEFGFLFEDIEDIEMARRLRELIK